MKRAPDPLIALKKQVVQEVHAVYADLEAREKSSHAFERNCTGIAECCHFVLTGATPYLTEGEALVAAKAWRATGRAKFGSDGDRCPFLSAETRKCLIYKDRPFGCRTHFCAGAGGPYARRDLLDLIQRLEEIGRKLVKGKRQGGHGGHHGPTPLPTAVGEALNEESGGRMRNAF